MSYGLENITSITGANLVTIPFNVRQFILLKRLSRKTWSAARVGGSCLDVSFCGYWHNSTPTPHRPDPDDRSSHGRESLPPPCDARIESSVAVASSPGFYFGGW